MTEEEAKARVDQFVDRAFGKNREVLDEAFRLGLPVVWTAAPGGELVAKIERDTDGAVEVEGLK